ncbi:D-cysteine desulfhydrase family protein [Halioxenophilus sp. WMMB6]|uniref:D-cysteine desulfhydrase family protein n=1 Tax=Halioxenophilus sp. WMMB6 TaxID=3073815 RepID=UPI00295F4B9D|nr:D-cysteine desulfhydrase family protein [Halioxenophilus sp. WMMB6]
MLPFPPRISLARTPTPFENLNRVGLCNNAPRLWIKRDDLTGSGLSGNKVRKLEYVIAQALAEGCDTLITCGGLQSNHCRATALVGAQLGLSVHLVLREEGSGELDGNLFLDTLAGALVERIPRKEYFTSINEILDQRREDYASRGKKAYVIPTGASDEVGIWGYAQCARELVEDFKLHDLKRTVIACASGSGGTQAGLSLGAHYFLPGTKVIGYAVCDDSEYFNNKVREDITRCCTRYGIELEVSNLAIETRDHAIGPGYAKGYPSLFECIINTARQSGLLLDPVYTGKGFHGLLKDIEAGLYADVDDLVFVHTGGIFGTFAFKEQFGFEPKD